MRFELVRNKCASLVKREYFNKYIQSSEDVKLTTFFLQFSEVGFYYNKPTFLYIDKTGILFKK